MIRILSFDAVAPQDILNRDIRAEADVEAVVDGIIADVRARGDAALRDYARKFDHAELDSLLVTQAEIDEAFAAVGDDFIKTLRMAADNIRRFHEHQVHKDIMVNDTPGVVLGQKYTPIERAGVYVPGGTAAYPSTVLMDVIPAKVAGVREIVMTTPAGANGRVNPNILAAAAVAGIDKIVKSGGAQAVAALAYGTETVPAVDKIVGPGNIFVATAKRQLYGAVDIDMVAGPSEILVLADETADPQYVAADLMSQAEHDVLASAILITTSEKLARETVKELERQVEGLSRREIIRKSLAGFGGIIICENIDRAIELANEVAPEHLEVIVDNPFPYLGRLDNAGSIFLGQYSPEPLGDYYAGPNHVLPTSGTARFFSPLSVDAFVKKSSYIYYTKEALQEASEDIIRFANREGLTAHANSIIVRCGGEGEEA